MLFVFKKKESIYSFEAKISTSLNLTILGCFKDLWFIISLCTCSSIYKTNGIKLSIINGAQCKDHLYGVKKKKGP